MATEKIDTTALYENLSDVPRLWKRGYTSWLEAVEKLTEVGAAPATPARGYSFLSIKGSEVLVQAYGVFIPNLAAAERQYLNILEADMHRSDPWYKLAVQFARKHNLCPRIG